jgi:hypothetical protein
MSGASLAVGAEGPAVPPAPSHTQVVLLGTGTLNPLPERSGPATAIVVDGRAYLVDFRRRREPINGDSHG